MTEFIYNEWLKEYCSKCTNVFARDSEEIVKQFLESDELLPSEYGWRLSDVESLSKQAIAAKIAQELNKVYWTDLARNIEAYAVMTWWRGNELVRSCLNSLNAREVIVPAIAARSLLELSSVFLLNANSLEHVFKKVTFPPNTVITSEELDNLVAKMIWGTRYQPESELLKQTNIMTSIQKIAKNSGAEQVLPNYEFLCDIVHPSFIGNTTFWSHVQQKYPDGSERRLMSRLTERTYNTEITDKTLWALGWSAICLQNAFVMMRNAYAGMLENLNRP